MASTASRRQITRSLLAAALALVPLHAVAAPAGGDPLAAPGRAQRELLVVPNPGVAAGTVVERLADRGLTAAEIGESGVLLVRVVPESRDAAAERIEAVPGVEAAEPNAEVRLAALSNDPFVPQQWSFANRGGRYGSFSWTAGVDLDMGGAWERSTGAGTTVAVLDTGADFAQPDLDGQLWTNPGEVAGNGVDDDGDGHVDDVQGWDFVSDDPTPEDRHGHGTHVAGTIAAERGNGYAVAGVAPDTRVMTLRVLGDDGHGSTSDTVLALDYAGRHGANVANLSLTGGGSASYTAVARKYPSMLIAAAAGNDGRDLAASPTYPCLTDSPNIVCVGSTTGHDGLSDFSNYGTGVDVLAPGHGILSLARTSTGSATWWMSGTSMATPHVAGTAALVYSLRPDASAEWVRQRLMATALTLPTLDGKSGSGRLRSAVALTGLPRPAAAPPAPDVSVSQSLPTAAATFTWTSTPGVGYDCSLDDGIWSGCVSGYTPVVAVGPHTLQVRARNADGQTSAVTARAWTVEPGRAPLPLLLVLEATPAPGERTVTVPPSVNAAPERDAATPGGARLPAVRAERHGRRVVVSVTLAQRGKVRVALRAARCVRTGGKRRCRTLERTLRTVTLRAGSNTLAVRLPRPRRAGDRLVVRAGGAARTVAL